VEKGGEIIPKVVGVDLEARPEGTVLFLYITHCPECGTPLERDPEEAKHFCPNRWGCPPQIKGRIEHFMSRKAMNILGGEALVEQLFSKELVKDPSDLYGLTPDMLKSLDNWGDKSTENLLKSIDASHNVPFHRFLYAIGIPYVGETTAKYLASHFGSLDNLRHAPDEELTQAPEIGEKISSSIIQYFKEPRILAMLEKLREAGLPFSQAEEERATLSDKLRDKQLVISGNFSRSREEMKKLIESHGGKVISAISGQTDYLLAGEKPGPAKWQKATKLNIPIINETGFLRLIGELPGEGTVFETEQKTTLF
jgi:DNA ligase (NAD+)